MNQPAALILKLDPNLVEVFEEKQEPLLTQARTMIVFHASNQ